MARHPLKADQFYILDEADAALHRTLTDARPKLTAAGVHPTDPDTPFCFRCHCPGFITRSVDHGGLGLPKSACGRSGCGHQFTSHNVF